MTLTLVQQCPISNLSELFYLLQCIDRLISFMQKVIMQKHTHAHTHTHTHTHIYGHSRTFSSEENLTTIISTQVSADIMNLAFQTKFCVFKVNKSEFNVMVAISSHPIEAFKK